MPRAICSSARGEVLSDALVHAEAESKMSASVAVDVEAVWIVDESVVPVPGGQIHEHGKTSTNQVAAEGQVVNGHAVDLAVHDGEVAHEFLDDIRDHRRIVGLSQPCQVVGMLQQCKRSSAIMLAVVS